MTPEEVRDLEQAIERIVETAHEFGLDFFQMRYEICPADIIYTFGAYAMPIRFHHWSFGKAFHRMKMDYDYGMAKIYELVINSDPCYAFLLDTNSLLQNKLIAAHVLAHCDFFKNNWRFRDTNRKMVWSMASFAERVRHYEFEHGRDRVERFLDAVLAIQEHIDPFPNRGKPMKDGDKPSPNQTNPGSAYNDLWQLDQYVPSQQAEAAATTDQAAMPPPPSSRPAVGPFGFPTSSHPLPGPMGSGSQAGPRNPVPESPAPPKAGAERPAPKCEPTRDVLLFLMQHAPDLEPWQRDIISGIRAESLYFRPQMETKIMNEGWASIWHARIMRHLDLTAEESVEFAKMHAGVLAPSRFHLNPYHLGFHLFTDIEEKHGRDRIFEVREVDTDVSFIRNYLTEELVDKLDLYLYKKVTDRWEISHTNREWEQVRDGIVKLYTNGGIPYIYAEDYDWGKRAELYLRHAYEGIELDPEYLTRTLPHLYHIWGRPVHLETVEDDRPVRYTYNSKEEIERRAL